LWERAAAVLADGELSIELPSAAGGSVRARCSAVGEEGEPAGVLLALDEPAPRAEPRGRTRTSPTTAGGVGGVLAEACELGMPVLVRGEPGVGKATAIRAAAERADRIDLVELDAGAEPLEGTGGG
jgi:hypothetical protein